MMRLWRFLRRLRLTIYTPPIGQHFLGLGYHHTLEGPRERWRKGGENGLLMLDVWIADAEWDDPENDPRLATTFAPTCHKRSSS